MASPVENAKQHLISILEQQPDDSSYDELLKELAFARMISRGLKDMETGSTSTNDEVLREITSWRNQ